MLMLQDVLLAKFCTVSKIFIKGIIDFVSMQQRGSDLSEFRKGQIHALRFVDNFKFKMIADAIGISESAVQKYCYRYNAENVLDNVRKNCGRHSATIIDIDNGALFDARGGHTSY